MISNFILFTLAISVIIQLGFWVFIFSRIIFHKERSDQTHHEKRVSVIVAAKNEEKNISNCLKAITQEKEPISEIIVIDDYSLDNTPVIIKAFQQLDDRIIYLKPTRDVPGKKLAITEAIEKASSEIILLTDADCVPSTSHWAGILFSKLTPGKNIVLAYSPIKQRWGLINLWARFETWITAVQYFSFAMVGMPYMGVGRNLMYLKSVFDKSDGFNSHKTLISGDDDLFVNQVANKSNTTLCLDPDSFVYTESANSFKHYFIQKIRHISVSDKYKPQHILVLSLFSISHILFYVCTFVLISMGEIKIIPLILFVLVVKWIVAFQGMKKMKETMWLVFPFLDIVLALYYIIMSPFLLIRNKTW